MEAGAGSSGAVAVPGVSLDPIPSKWNRFGDCFAKQRVKCKIGGKKWRVVNPNYWDLGLSNGQEEKQGRAVLAGLAVAGATPAVSDLNPRNAVKAVLGRVMRCPAHTPVVGIWDFVKRFESLLLPGLFDDYEPMTEQQWLATMPARRRRALEDAMQKVWRLGWHESWEWFKAFIKSEKIPGFGKSGGLLVPTRYMLDRLIQGPADETHCIVGRFIKPVIHQLKKSWGVDGPIFYASCSVEKLNSWFRRWYQPGTLAVMCDYSMFDNSHSAQSWAYVESVYERLGLYEMHPYFKRVMDCWRAPQGRIKGKGWCVKYKGRVMNASGRDDTALSNGLLNGLCFFLSACAALLRKPVTALTSEDVSWGLRRIHVSVCGDDSLCLIETSLEGLELELFQQRLSDNIASFGFDAGADKMVVSRDPFKMVYLGMRPYPCGGQWYFARTIGRAIWKVGWVLDGVDVDCPSRVTGDCEAILATQAVVPVLSDFAVGYLAARVGCKRLLPTVDPNRPWTTGVETPPYDAETLHYVAAGYELSIAELDSLCEALRSRRSFPWVCDHPALLRLVYVDDL